MVHIEVSGLTKSYGPHDVLLGVDLTARRGEIVGILGPNGSGKTTLVECIGGLRRRDGGTVRVDGMDAEAGDPRLRAVLGMQLQQCRLPAKMTTIEAIDLFRSFYRHPQDADVLLERFGLGDQRDRRFEHLSGGQQQRLSVALALVGRPVIAVLDELTTGLDPAARREIWTFLEGLTGPDGERTTILLVTHSMEEAERLCDRVVILDGGRVVADDTPAALASGAASTQRLTFVPSSPVDVDELRRLPGVESVEVRGERLTVIGGAEAPQTVLAHLSGLGVTAGGLHVAGGTLDDAYLHTTSRRPEPEDAR